MAVRWKHPGFSAHIGEPIAREEKQRLADTAAYLVRDPLSLKKLVCLDGERAVVYRSRTNHFLRRSFEDLLSPVTTIATHGCGSVRFLWPAVVCARILHRPTDSRPVGMIAEDASPTAGSRWFGPLALLALAIGLFHRILFAGEALFERDIALLVYPQQEALLRCVAMGSWPVWDPYTAFGEPMLANAGRQVLYPTTWLALFAPLPLVFALFVVAHVFLTGWGLSRLARHLGLSELAAMCSGGLFMTSGPVLSLVNVPPHLAGIAWMPWVLLGMGTTLRAPAARSAVWWAVAQSLQVLGGSPDVVVFTAALQSAWLLVHLARYPGSAWAVLRAVSTAALAAAGLTAVQWLPSVELFLAGARYSFLEGRDSWSIHPLTLVTAILSVPLRDLPLRKELSEPLGLAREPFLSSLFLGAAALPLVLLGATAKRPLARVMVALAIGATLVALGRFGVAHGLLTTLVPPLRLLRYPAKYLLLVALAWALLAGIGWDLWRGRSAGRVLRGSLAALLVLLAALAGGLSYAARPPVARWVANLLSPPEGGFASVGGPLSEHLATSALLTVVASIACLAPRRYTRRTAMVLAIVAVTDTALAHFDLNPTMPRRLLDQPPAALALLRGTALPRVYSFDYTLSVVGRNLGRPSNKDLRTLKRGLDLSATAADCLGGLERLRGFTLPRWGVQGSFVTDVVGVQSAAQDDLRLFAESLTGIEHTRLLRVAGVTHVVSLHSEGLQGLEPLAAVNGVYTREIQVWRVSAPMPRVYAVGGASVRPGFEAYRRLVSDGFDPTSEVVLREGAAGLPAEATAYRAGVRLEEYRCDRVRASIRGQAPGFLVITDAWDPLWRAMVDRGPAPILRSNVAFRSVPVPAGEHVVEVLYRPRSVVAGLILTAGTIVLLLAGWLYGRKQAL